MNWTNIFHKAKTPLPEGNGVFDEAGEIYFFFAAGLRLAALRLAGALRAVVFLAATGPPRGKTLGLPEGSLNQECQT